MVFDRPERQPAEALSRLRDELVPEWGVVGIGEPLARDLGASVAGLRTFPTLSGVGVENPRTQHALWVRACVESLDRFERMLRHGWAG